MEPVILGHKKYVFDLSSVSELLTPLEFPKRQEQ